jgi:hypothetical protein
MSASPRVLQHSGSASAQAAAEQLSDAVCRDRPIGGTDPQSKSLRNPPTHWVSSRSPGWSLALPGRRVADARSAPTRRAQPFDQRRPRSAPMTGCRGAATGAVTAFARRDDGRPGRREDREDRRSSAIWSPTSRPMTSTVPSTVPSTSVSPSKYGRHVSRGIPCDVIAVSLGRLRAQPEDDKVVIACSHRLARARSWPKTDESNGLRRR